jgi:hypothetical protein
MRQAGRSLPEYRELRTRAPLIQAYANFQKQSVLSAQDEARNTCINHLRQIDGASQQCALENKLSAREVVTKEQILPYLRNGNEVFTCPSGGSYTFGSLTNNPACSFPGHAIPEIPTN